MRLNLKWAVGISVLCLGVPQTDAATVHANVPTLAQVQAVTRAQRITLYNIDAADSTNANELWSGGALGLNLTGSGVTVGIWDGGPVRNTHQELAGRVTIIDSGSFGNLNSDHATHVAGTIGATGVNPLARGMASQVQIRSRNFTSANAEIRADAPLIHLSNHSYGQSLGWEGTVTLAGMGTYDLWYGDWAVSQTEDNWFGWYNSTAADLDDIAYKNPHLLSVYSAGNDRNDAFTNAGGNGRFVVYSSVSSAVPVGSTSLGGGFYVVPAGTTPPGSDGNNGTGYDCLPAGGQTAKNTLVVGAMNDYTQDPHNGANMTLSAFSSWGGTDDGRLGVHVVGNGVSLYSSTSGSNSSYGTFSGTSMSAPNVTGTAALLLEHWRNEGLANPRAATQKALLVHTATDVNTPAAGDPYNKGPDYATGYGMVNGARGAEFITESLTAPVATRTDWAFEDALSNSELWSFSFLAGPGDIKTTLCWTDPAGTIKADILDNAARALVNDLDLWIDVAGTVYYPWTLDINNPAAPAVRTARNAIDNLEQVLIDMGVLSLGTPFTVFVSHTGSLLGGLDQDFSLLVSGATSVPEPATLALLAAVLLIPRRRH